MNCAFENIDKTALTLIDSQTFSTGVIAMHYAPKIMAHLSTRGADDGLFVGGADFGGVVVLFGIGSPGFAETLPQ